jgi:dTDP-4-dehydrorhamnose 3,5-epimerase
MIITETKLKGAFAIDLKRHEDERGFFAQMWTQRELEERGMEGRFVQCNVSYNNRRGTLRGLHYQAPPDAQAKLISCTAGSIYDVGIDLRPDSSTFRQWVGVELSADNHRMLYLPGDFAHGYLTLEDDTEVFYLVSSPYAPQSERGVRWDDPAFRVAWPGAGEFIVNERDNSFSDFAL